MNITAMSTPLLEFSFEELPLTSALIADLRSDHAGEVGAVGIYRGILKVSKDPEVRKFAREHLETEIRHRQFFDAWLPVNHHSRLVQVWRGAGWSLGAVAALFGQRCVFLTIAAVESFVEEHYQSQISAMGRVPQLTPLVTVLKAFCGEEIEHRDDAAGRVKNTKGWLATMWARLIGGGSALGVSIARQI